MKNFDCTSCRAFTLIELVVTLLLVGLLAGAGTGLVVYVVQGYQTVRAQARLAQAAELALGRLVREARDADVIGGGGSSITFTRAGTARGFALSGNTLGMQVGGTVYPLMRGVAGFAVERLAAGDAELLRFTLTPEGGGPDFMTGHLVVVDDD